MTACMFRDPKIDEEVVLGWMKGNRDAVVFIMQFFFVAHLWDDLVDRDRDRTEADINQAFQILMLDMQENPFYITHIRSLNPVIRCALNDWYTANELERTGYDHERDISYTLRCSVLSVVSHAAYLVGGTDWVKRVGPEIRRYGQEHTLEDYKRGIPCQT